MVKVFNRKIIFSIVVLCLLGIIIINVVSRSTGAGDYSYISPAADKVSYSDVKDYLKKIDFSKIKDSAYFKGNTVNRQTIKFFKYMQFMFKDKEMNDHLAAVNEYLLSIMEPSEAEQLMQIYKKFLEYENRIAEVINRAGVLNSTDDYLNLLRKIRNIQVDMFGEENADILFGAEMKAQEYPVRRNAIIGDADLYGREKEEKIAQLNNDMWGDQAAEIESARKPYTRYQDKLNIYSRDLREMDEAARKQKIQEFRAEVFPPDVVERLNDVDEQLALENQRDTNYQNAYNQISGDPNLTDEEKKEKVRELQNNTYGDEAESVRRREEIDKGKEALKKQYGL